MVMGESEWAWVCKRGFESEWALVFRGALVSQWGRVSKWALVFQWAVHLTLRLKEYSHPLQHRTLLPQKNRFVLRANLKQWLSSNFQRQSLLCMFRERFHNVTGSLRYRAQSLRPKGR